MARRPTTKPIPFVREYLVYVPGLNSVGEVPVKENAAGDRVVLMTPAQAQYWVDQAAIGLKPLSDEGARVQAQMRRVESE